MKKILFTLSFTSLFIVIQAQAWDVNLNHGSTLKLGQSGNDPLNFYINSNKVMTLGTDGKLLVDSLAGTESRALFADEFGSIIAGPKVGYNGGPCVASANAWAQGGNTPFNTTTSNRAGTCNAVDFILKSYNNESIFLKTDGKVGIGLNNSSPSAPFDLFDGITSGNTDHLKFYPDATGTIESTTNMNLQIASGKSFYIKEGSNSPFVLSPSQLGLNVDLDLNGNNFTSGYISTGAISASGNISTSQHMIATGNVTSGGKFESTSTTSSNEAIKVTNTTASTTNFLVLNSGQTTMGYQSGSSNSAMLNINVAGGSTPTKAIDMWDQYTGDVNFRLKSDGELYSRYIKVMTGGFPDYVFAKDYKLPELTAVENFYKTNKHLEGVPTAVEVEKNGLDLGEINKILVKKIEELTIYAVEQNKKSTFQQKELDELKKQVSELNDRK